MLARALGVAAVLAPLASAQQWASSNGGYLTTFTDNSCLQINRTLNLAEGCNTVQLNGQTTYVSLSCGEGAFTMGVCTAAGCKSCQTWPTTETGTCGLTDNAFGNAPVGASAIGQCSVTPCCGTTAIIGSFAGILGFGILVLSIYWFIIQERKGRAAAAASGETSYLNFSDAAKSKGAIN